MLADEKPLGLQSWEGERGLRRQNFQWGNLFLVYGAPSARAGGDPVSPCNV